MHKIPVLEPDEVLIIKWPKSATDDMIGPLTTAMEGWLMNEITTERVMGFHSAMRLLVTKRDQVIIRHRHAPCPVCGHYMHLRKDGYLCVECSIAAGKHITFTLEEMEKGDDHSQPGAGVLPVPKQ